jgi:hypothetical protein
MIMITVLFCFRINVKLILIRVGKFDFHCIFAVLRKKINKETRRVIMINNDLAWNSGKVNYSGNEGRHRL